MLRSALLVTIGVAFTAYICLVVIILSLFSGGADRAHKVARIWAKIMLLISSTRVTVIGGHNVLSKQPRVFMCNHQSDFDILVAMAHIPGQFRWLAKKELFRIPIFGPAMRGVGYIEIDRQDHQKAMKSLDKAAENIRQGKSVITFPEGTRSRDGQVKPFKPGTFYLAIRSGAPIVPVTIVGTAEIMPRRSLKVRPGRVTLIIAPPIDVTDYTIDTRDLLIKLVRDIIMENKEKYGNP